jgi:hypothetical protein
MHIILESYFHTWCTVSRVHINTSISFSAYLYNSENSKQSKAAKLSTSSASPQLFSPASAFCPSRLPIPGSVTGAGSSSLVNSRLITSNSHPDRPRSQLTSHTTYDSTSTTHTPSLPPPSIHPIHFPSSPLSLRPRSSAGHSSLHPAHRLDQLRPPSTLHLTTAEQPQPHSRCVATP